jgi:hypothetical protein
MKKCEKVSVYCLGGSRSIHLSYKPKTLTQLYQH